MGVLAAQTRTDSLAPVRKADSFDQYKVKKHTWNCYCVLRNLMSLWPNCSIQFSSEKILSASTITKRFNSKKIFRWIQSRGAINMQIIFRIYKHWGKNKQWKKASAFPNQRKCFTNSQRMWLNLSHDSKPLQGGRGVTTCMLALNRYRMGQREKGEHANSLSPSYPRGQALPTQTSQCWLSNSTARFPLPLIIHHE